MMKLVLGSLVALLALGPIAAEALQATVTWTASGSVQARIERSNLPAGPFTTQGTVAAGVTTFNETGLALNTQYCYRVVEFNTFGDAPASSVACGTPAAPGGASNITVIFAP